MASTAHAAAAIPHLIEWTPALSVGIDEIDAQHRVLVDLINQLHAAIVAHRGTQEVPQILDRLVDYTRIHFAVEESLMRLFDYPDYEQHKHSHELLVDEVVRLRQRMLAEGKPVTFELLHFLKKWLTAHIMESDALYTPYFLSRGVQARTHKPSWLQRLWARRGD